MFLKYKQMLVHYEQKIRLFGLSDPKASSFAVVLVFDDVLFECKTYFWQNQSIMAVDNEYTTSIIPSMPISP